MAKYGKLWFRVWSDDDFTALSTAAQRLYFVLVSYPTRTNAGVLPLQLKRLARTSSDGTVEDVTDALKELDATRFVVVDWDTEEVLVRTFIRNDEVAKQPNVMKSALDSSEHVQSSRLRWALYHELLNLPDDKDPDRTAAAAKALVAGLQKPSPESFAEPLGEPLGEGLPEPLSEGLGEPPVVVGYVSGEEATTTSTSISTATAAVVTLAETPAKADAPTGAAPRGSYLPAGWMPDDSTRAWAKSNYGHMDLAHELRQFVSYWSAESGQRARKRNWNQAFRNWLGKNPPSRSAANGARPSTTDRGIAETQALKSLYLANPIGELA